MTPFKFHYLHYSKSYTNLENVTLPAQPAQPAIIQQQTAIEMFSNLICTEMALQACTVM